MAGHIQPFQLGHEKEEIQMTESMTVAEVTDEVTVDDVLAMTMPELQAFALSVEVPAYSDVYTREQNAGPRAFNVRGPKAWMVRQLIFAGLELTRLEIASLSDCSVSRVGEVVWGLEHDGVTFPNIPKRRKTVVIDDDTTEVVSEDATS
jgi:hypothetical protein